MSGRPDYPHLYALLERLIEDPSREVEGLPASRLAVELALCMTSADVETRKRVEELINRPPRVIVDISKDGNSVRFLP